MNLGCFQQENNHAVDCELARVGNGSNEIAHLERLFRVEIVGVLSSFHKDGRVRSILSCLNATGGHSEMMTDISDEARSTLPFIWDTPEPEPSPFKRWINGEYPCAAWLENLFAHHETKTCHRSPPARSNDNGKRKLQMDKKFRTWLIDAEGTRKSISCREICDTFDGRIVTRLRAGIDSGADISTEEIDD